MTRKPLFHNPYNSYDSLWTCPYTLSLSKGMQFTNCTTRKPLFHDLYDSYKSCGKENAIIWVVLGRVHVYWTTLDQRAAKQSTEVSADQYHVTISRAQV